MDFFSQELAIAEGLASDTFKAHPDALAFITFQTDQATTDAARTAIVVRHLPHSDAVLREAGISDEAIAARQPAI